MSEKDMELDDQACHDPSTANPKTKLKEAYKCFAQETSAHGFRWTIDCHNALTGGLWSFLIFLAIVTAFFSVGSVTNDYITGPRFSSEYNLISSAAFAPRQGKGIKMPDVVLCDPNPFDQNKIESLNISYRMISYIYYILSPFTSNPSLFRNKKNEMKLQRLETEYKHLLSERFNGDLISLLNQTTVDCEDFIVMCKEGLNDAVSGHTCCNSIFQTGGVFTYDGKCFTTQGAMNYSLYFPAKANGVSITVKGSPDISHKLDHTISSWITMSRKGVGFAVSDNLTHPTVSLMQRGLGARMNTITDVPIKKETIDFTNTLAASWFHSKQCFQSNEKDTEHYVPGFKHYSNENCKMAKVQRAANFFFGCNMLAIPVNNTELPFCSPMQSVMFFQGFRKVGSNPRKTIVEMDKDVKNFLKSMDPIEREYYEDLAENLGDDDDNDESSDEMVAFYLSDYYKKRLEDKRKIYKTSRCPKDCAHSYYQTSVSSFDVAPGFIKLLSRKYESIRRVSKHKNMYAKWRPMDMDVNLRQLMNLTKATKYVNESLRRKFKDTKTMDFAILEFFFPSFDFIQIVQHRRGPLEWLADIGGSLGLYLGASVFTIVEIFWFFGKFIVSYATKIIK